MNKVSLDVGKVKVAAEKAGEEGVRDLTRRIFNRSQVLCPVDQGRLRTSGRMSVNGLRGLIEYTANYAAAVHDGRRAIDIVPRKGKVLRFVVGGQVVYAKRVHQGPRAGKPFLRDAASDIARQDGASFRPY